MKLTASELDTKVTLPNKDEIDIKILPNFEKLTGIQKDFLVNYISSHLQKTKSLLMLGVSSETFKKWEEDTNFKEAVDIAQQLYTESLRSTHFIDSFHNSKIRVKTLAALDAEGFQEKGKLQAKNQQNNFIFSDSLADMIHEIKKLNG